MRALVLEDWYKLTVVDWPDPVAAPGDVVLEINATGICGSDVHGFTGETGRRQRGQIMGHETVGRIVALGAEIDPSLGLELGGIATVNPVLNCGCCERCVSGAEQACSARRVLGVEPSVPAAFAEQMVVPARNVVALPSSMPIEFGALVEPLAVGYHAVRRSRMAPVDRVLVLGGGPIGQACALAVQREGVGALVVSEPRIERRRLIDSLGIAAFEAVGDSDFAESIAEILGGPPTVVIDAVGSGPTLDAAFSAAPPGATLVLVGMGAAQIPLQAYEVSTKERSIVGSFCYTREEFAATAAWVGTAPANLARLIDGHVGLDGADAAFAELARGENPASKVLVLPGT